MNAPTAGGEDGAPTRSKALSTRLLLLLEIHNHRHSRLRTLAERLDVTVQAVSEYLKRLTHEALVENVAGFWRPTKKGTMFLHESMRDLRRFVDRSMGQLHIINETHALAERRIRPDDEVGLFLRAGRLYAGQVRKGASRGRARTGAGPGQLVLVGDLKGLLELEPAPLTVLCHPDFPKGPALERARREVARIRRGGQQTLVAAHGVQSLAWADSLGLEVDIEFAPVPAAREAAQRGVPVVYLVPTAEAAAVVAQLREATAGESEPPPIRSVDL